MDKNSYRAPVMLFDGECGFCRGWIKKWNRITGELVSYEPYQEALPRFSEVTRKQCEEAVQLIMPGGKVYSGAHAVFKTLALSGKHPLPLRLYEKLPLFGRVSELFYQLVARHRIFFSRFG